MKIIRSWMYLHFIVLAITSLPKSNLYMSNLVETSKFVFVGIILTDFTIAIYIINECFMVMVKKWKILRKRKEIKSGT